MIHKVIYMAKGEPTENRGRKSKLNDETKDIILKHIADGMPVKLSCMAAGVSENTFYQWKRKGSREPNGYYGKFFKEVQTAEGQAISVKMMQVHAASQRSWQAAAWWLERRYPEYFGRREFLQTELTGKDGGSININSEQKIYDASDLKEVINLEEAINGKRKAKGK